MDSSTSEAPPESEEAEGGETTTQSNPLLHLNIDEIHQAIENEDPNALASCLPPLDTTVISNHSMLDLLNLFKPRPLTNAKFFLVVKHLFPLAFFDDNFDAPAFQRKITALNPTAYMQNRNIWRND